MTGKVFPLPNKWSTRPLVALTIAAVLFAGVGVWFLVAALLSALDVDWLRSIFLVFTGGAFVALGAIPATANRVYQSDDPSTARILFTDNRLRILPDRAQQIVSLSLGVMFVVAAFIFAIGTWTSTLDLPISPGFAVFYPPFALGTAVLVMTMLFRVWRRGGSYGQLALDPVSVSHESGELRTELHWADIAAFSINRPRMGRTGSAACMIYLQPADGTPPLAVTTNMLSTGCAPTYWLLKYYFEHPEHRDELGDQRAVDRLMSGRVVTRR
ncbi:hypothetical protein [Williamsia phyllosphaerae]|uniref:hypothetical protein n=1 Tax=Williamsia phyllosphaerae TaxID=885042 RepID=UPI00166673A0|nr:hypothetical protein [Williamsia phyllosphaerae]